MRVAKRKNKMLSIRLSAEQYESLKSLYLSRGLRSVSALARDAVDQVVNGNHLSLGPLSSHRELEVHVHLLDAQVNLLRGEVLELSRRVAESQKQNAT